MRAAFALLLAAAMSHGDMPHGWTPDPPRSARPVGPGSLALASRYSPPLPKPASQAKRRRLARRMRGGR